MMEQCWWSIVDVVACQSSDGRTESVDQSLQRSVGSAALTDVRIASVVVSNPQLEEWQRRQGAVKGVVGAAAVVKAIVQLGMYLL